MPDSVVGQIALELGLESANFKKQLMNICNREGSSAAQSLTNTFTKAFSQIGTVMAAAFSAGKIIEFGKKCIGSAASVNAANSQLEQTFGSLQEKAETAMKTVAKESGIVETRLQGVGTSIYAFAKTSGMDSATALSMMQEALQVTADSAAYYDRSLEDTAESLKSFLKGNYANDAALGISCTETTRNAAANKLYGKSFQQLSEAQKQLTLLQMVKDANKLSGALGQAARESDGWENVTGNLTESFKQLFAVIGQPILAIATKGVKALTAAIQKLTVYAKTAVKAISDMFGLQMSDSVDSMAAMSDTADSASEAIDDTTDAVKKLKKATAGFDQLNILSSNKSDDSTTDTSSAALSVPIDTSAAENSVGEFENIFDKLKNKFNHFLKNTGLDSGFERIRQKTTAFVQEISSSVQSGLSELGGFFTNLWNVVSDSFNSSAENTKQAFSTFLDSIIELVGGVFVIIANAFEIATKDLSEWITENYDTIKEFFDNTFQVINDTIGEIGEIIQDLADIIINWWENDGKKLVDTLCKVILDIGTLCLEVFNKWIMPVWNALVKIVESFWYDCLKPIIEKLLEVLSKLWNDIIYPLWENLLKPLCNWLISILAPAIKFVADMIASICQTIFQTIGGFIMGILRALGGLIDFLSGIFTGNWEKAWKGICDFSGGIIESIYQVFKGFINLIIDALNALWGSVYHVTKGVVDSIGDVAGSLGDLFGQNWHFNMPEQPSLIPHLAAGGLVKAPTLALVGDNKGASHDPEVVSPLSKLQDMMNSGNPEIIRLLLRIIALLENEETTFQNNFYVDSEKIESRLVKVRRRKQRRYGGAAV